MGESATEHRRDWTAARFSAAAEVTTQRKLLSKSDATASSNGAAMCAAIRAKKSSKSTHVNKARQSEVPLSRRSLSMFCKYLVMKLLENLFIRPFLLLSTTHHSRNHRNIASLSHFRIVCKLNLIKFRFLLMLLIDRNKKLFIKMKEKEFTVSSSQ